MKLLSVIDSLGRAGAEQAMLNLLSALQTRGYQCEVAVLWPPYDLAPAFKQRGINVHCLNLNHRWNLIAGISLLSRLIYRERFHLVHAHLFFSSIYVAASCYLAPSPKRVVTFHGIDYAFHPANTLGLRLRKALHAWLMRFGMEGHSAVSRVVAQHFEEHLGLRKVHIIPNGIALSEIKDQLQVPVTELLDVYPFLRQVGDHKFTFVMPARLMPEKGHQYLLEAVALLKKRGMVPQIFLLGDGPCRHNITQKVQDLGIRDQIVIAGEVTQAQVMQLLPLMDAFVLSSTHEGFGLAVVEAMVFGLPVLVTDCGGTRDIVEHQVSGLVVPPADPSALAMAMGELMEDEGLRRRLGRAGQQHVESHFSTDRVAGQWEKFYCEVLEGK